MAGNYLGENDGRSAPPLATSWTRTVVLLFGRPFRGLYGALVGDGSNKCFPRKLYLAGASLVRTSTRAGLVALVIKPLYESHRGPSPSPAGCLQPGDVLFQRRSADRSCPATPSGFTKLAPQLTHLCGGT